MRNIWNTIINKHFNTYHMKKTFLFICTFFYIISSFGQANENLDITELLDRYHAIPPNGTSLAHYFTSSEMTTLTTYFATLQNNVVTENRESNNTLIYGNNPLESTLHTFEADTPETATNIGSDLNHSDFESAGDIDPQNLNTAYIITYENGRFYELDLTTTTYTFLGIISPPNTQFWNGLEFDVVTNTLYAISSNFVGTSTLYTIDINNLTATFIGETGTPGMIAIAIDNDNKMYGHDVASDSFYTIDMTTGVATMVGSLNFDANFGQDLEWNASTGTMYMASGENVTGKNQFREVNTSTGETTIIGLIAGGMFGRQMPWASIRNTTLSVDDFSATSLSVFPNPAENVISIHTTAPITSLKIINMLGQIVLENNTVDNQQTIDISNLTKGIYFIQAIQDSSEQRTIRFIKK